MTTPMRSPEEIKPFSTGTQFMDWQEANCFRCKKFNEDVTKTCDIEAALGLACIGSGKITLEMAKRCGFIGNENKFQWMCPEVEWTEEWKQKFAALHPENGGGAE